MYNAVRLIISRVLLLLWALSALPALASLAPPLSLSSATGMAATTGHVAYLPERGPWRPAEVMLQPPSAWTFSQGTPNLGFTTQAYWFRIDVSGSDITDGILAILYPALDDVRVFEVTPDGGVLHSYRFGDMHAAVKTELPNRYFLTPVRLNPGESRIFLMRVETEGSLQLPLKYFDRQHFYDREQRTLLIEGVYFGILFIMAVYNFFIFLILRDASHVWYSLFVFMILMFQVSLSGFGFQFLWPLLPAINSFIVPLTMSGCLFTGAMFSLRFLNPGNRFSRIRAIFRITALTGLVIMALSVFSSYEVAVRAAVVACGVMAVYSIGAGFHIWLKGVAHARYYTIAWSFLMPTIAILSLNKQGLLPVNFFTEYAIQIGSVLEASLFSFALGDRISLERRDKIQEQARMIDKERALREELQRSHAQELVAQQKAVAAEAESRAKTRFLATMSHEIRTPLNGILGMIELLQESELQPHQRTYAGVIAQSGQTLLSVINDILDYSRITAGKMPIEQLDFDLDRLCADSVSLFAYTAGKKQIELLACREADVPAFIHSDPTRIRQILLNLLGNAFKFTDKGRVEVRLSMDEEDGRRFVRFTVTDTGIGIDPEQQDQVFESFAQGDSSMTRRFGGTGLGLAISRKLSTLLGGDIGVESRPGQGSVFWFRIAFLPAAPALQQQWEQGFRACRDKRLLLVDASPSFTHAIAVQALQVGMSVATASGVEELLKLMEQGASPDLVVLDSRSADSPGIACAAMLDKESRWRAIPRIALTGMPLPIAAGEPVLPGMMFTRPHPVSGREFLELLMEVFERPRAQAEVASMPPVTDAFSGKRILVADDNDVNLTVITALLKKLGITVMQTVDGEQAAEYACRHHADIDLILMDCEMPVMDGFLATERIRQYEQQHFMPPVPIVALTAHALPEYQERCLAGGMDAYLAKPVQLRMLSEVLENCWR
ncbi:MAG TPA: 7TM diverse intracellular signaling domain-containing protein [Fluviicoccus sp.]|nr:7TM diverse intracellular signaling domain-containing protein [Fluviicoccus sp.]